MKDKIIEILEDIDWSDEGCSNMAQKIVDLDPWNYSEPPTDRIIKRYLGSGREINVIFHTVENSSEIWYDPYTSKFIKSVHFHPVAWMEVPKPPKPIKHKHNGK